MLFWSHLHFDNVPFASIKHFSLWDSEKKRKLAREQLTWLQKCIPRFTILRNNTSISFQFRLKLPKWWSVMRINFGQILWISGLGFFWMGRLLVMLTMQFLIRFHFGDDVPDDIANNGACGLWFVLRPYLEAWNESILMKQLTPKQEQLQQFLLHKWKVG